MQRQATLKSSNNQPTKSHFNRRLREGVFICLFATALYFLLSLTTYHHSDPAWSHLTSTQHIANSGGRIGAWLADILLFLMGYFSYSLPVVILFAAWFSLQERPAKVTDYWQVGFRVGGALLFFLAGTALFGMANWGGVIGEVVSERLTAAFNPLGTTVLLFAVLLSSLTFLTGISWLVVTERIGNWVLPWLKKAPGLMKSVRLPKRESAAVVTSESKKPLVQKITPQLMTITKPEVDESNPIYKPAITPPAGIIKVSKRAVKEAQLPLFESTADGTMPSLNLLDLPGKPSTKNFSSAKLEMMSREVEQRLADFGVEVQVVAVHPGPVITRFEMQLAPGVKVSKISGLAKDLARSLSVTSVRIVDVIAGKTVVGLELPNEERETVRLSEVLASQQFDQARSPLSMALGKDIAGHPVVVDLAKMPHLLVAGTTGSGKSVGLNAMILSLLYKATPDEVRMILIDPKMLELSIYDDIPHLLTPVVVDMNEAQQALRWCVAEMERRYRLMSALGVRNLAGFNQKVTDAIKAGTPLYDPKSQQEGVTPVELEPLPYIVIVIDELADMMMVVGKKVEQLIARIAQKARAAGIHMILATQRPSVDVLTGLIKSNIPTRIAFQVSSKIDSRTILDQQGADQLLGHGDMLYLAPGSSVPVRIHGAYVADHEVHNVTDDWKKRGRPVYIDDIGAELEANSQAQDFSFMGEGSGDVEDNDPLYDEAVSFVLQSRKASISSVQRRFKVGYNRAARLIEEMERAGIVSAMEANGSREVLVPNHEN